MRYARHILLSLLLCACAITSRVMEAEDGTYMISAAAAPARGGSAGATDAAYEEAQRFCSTQGARAVVVSAGERDVQQGVISGSWGNRGGGLGGASFAAGRAVLRFRCAR